MLGARNQINSTIWLTVSAVALYSTKWVNIIPLWTQYFVRSAIRRDAKCSAIWRSEVAR